MNGDTFSELKAGLARQEEALRALEFTVLVWGPGNEPFMTKRNQIVNQLNECGFRAFTSEDLALQVPSTLPLSLQEGQHWRLVDLVIILEAGVAPAMELASFAHDAEFCQKCIVFHPRDWDPAHQTTFPSEVLKLFANRVLYAEHEMEVCTLVAECLHRAEAMRRYRFLKESPGLMSF